MFQSTYFFLIKRNREIVPLFSYKQKYLFTPSNILFDYPLTW